MFAVIFEVSPLPGAWDSYLEHAAILRPELLLIDGFMANERFASQRRPGWLVSLSIWRDEKALIRWRTHALHNAIQGKGRSSILADYHLRVGEIVADSEAEGRLPQHRFDVTVTGLAKAVTATEQAGGQDAIQPAAGLVGADTFDSIARPGNRLSLRSWQDIEAAQAGIAGLPGRHRMIRVIRDYGMFDRDEAPQYYPLVSRP